ncbi:hypothetical protein Tco_0115636 [Tanacetum coccineum]
MVRNPMLYKTYYAFASGEKAPKQKYVRKKADPDTSPKQKLVQDTNSTRLKSKAKVALTEVEQLKLLPKEARHNFTVLTQVAQVMELTLSQRFLMSNNKSLLVQIKELDEEGNDMNDDDEETDSDRTKLDRIKILIRDQSTTEFCEEEEENIDDEEMMYDDEDDEVTKELYEDVNVNLGNEDTKMTNVDQGATDQQNVSQQLGFEQVEEDAHVTPVLDTQKTDEPVQSSSVSSNFTSKLLNLENPSPTDNEIASLMETLARHVTAVPENTFGFTTTIPQPPPVFNPLLQQATPTPIPTTSEATTSFPLLPDFTSIFKFNERVFNLEKDVQEAHDEKNAYIELVDTSMRALFKEEVNTQLPQILPQAVSDFANPRSRDEDKDRDPSARSDREKKRRKSSKDAESSRDSRSKENKSSSTSKDASQSQHKSSSKSAHAEDPSHIISQVTHAEEPPTSFDELNDTSFDFSAFVINRLKIPNLTQEILVGLTFNLVKGTCKSITELEYHLEECSKATTERLDWHNPENKLYLFDLRKPLPLIQDHRGRQIIPKDYFINKDLEYLKGGDLSRLNSTLVTKSKAATYKLKWIKDLVPELWSPMQMKYDQHAYFVTSHWGPKRQSFYGYACNLTSSKDVYSRRRIITVTRLTIMKKYDYGHLEEIEVRRDDQKLYTFKEGDFKRLRLQDIEDMLLLLVQQKLTNLTIDERYDLNVALRMYTRRIVIQRRVEDLQLGVESYQKKLNLTKPDTYISNLRNKTAYTSHSDPHGIVYVDQFKRKRLMRADELHKFSDGTLNDVRTTLHDIAAGIRMEYLPMRKWSKLDKKRARVMVLDIGKQLYQRRLMQNLEKFVSGGEYGKDLIMEYLVNISKRRAFGSLNEDILKITVLTTNTSSVENKFPAIAFDDSLTLGETLYCEPTVSSLDDEIDFKISFDDSDDKDYTVVFDKNSFSYKIISTNDLKTDSENDNEKVNLPSFSSPETMVSYFYDLDFFKDFENEFPAIVYNDAPTSKLDLLTEPILSPQHIGEFNLNDETSLSEYDEGTKHFVLQ